VATHTGNNAPPEIPVYPGEMFHVHFEMDTIDSATLNHPINYLTPTVAIVSPPGIGNPSSITLTITNPSFTPSGDPWIDFDPGCCFAPSFPSAPITPYPPPHANRILINVANNVPPGARFAINIPTQSLTAGTNGTASRVLRVIAPNTTLTKTASPTSGIAPLTVTYTITETNTGDVPLDEVVSDPNAGTCSPPLPDTHTFNPGESRTYTCTKTYTVPGTFTNTATASGHPIVFNPLTGANETVTNITVNETASATVKVITPNTTLTKTVDKSTVTPGETVTYTYNEKNTGDVNLTNVRVDDDKCSPVDPVLGSDGIHNIGDTNPMDNLLNPGETWQFTCKATITNTTTNTATGHGNPIINGQVSNIDITFPDFPAERAQTTVTIKTPCPSGECKFKTWGLLGNVANPEKKFEMLFFSPIPNGGPQGSMTVEDNNLNMTIQSTQVTSIVTDKNAGTGTATGRAHVTGGPHPGDYDFTVNVVDAAHSGTPRGTFEIILSGFPGGYDNSGPLSFGAISIIK
jgi:hypothetical protein